MNKLSILLAVILAFALSSGTGAAELIVQPGGSIQAAVNNATSSGDLILVKPGIYSENVIINKPNLAIKSESGDPENTVIMGKNPNTYVFYTEADNTTISGFKIKYGIYNGVAGIRLARCSNCTINNNNISGNDIGISSSNSNSNTISDNKINSNRHDGMVLLRSEGNVILNNIIYFNNHGIVLENSSSNSLTSNLVISNAGFGFYLRNSSENSLNINTAAKNDRGIYLLNSDTNKILSNDVSKNSNYGMLISYSKYNTISRNTANQTIRGIHLDSAGSNTISENVVVSNNISGFFMCRGCHRNLFFNNYASNTLNADINSTDTTWNITKTAGRNIVGGPYLGGNYWASPTGNGFSEIAHDKDVDGIADAQYTWTTHGLNNITDYLPLVSVPDPQLPALPVANLDSNVTIGASPLAVQFTDLSQNALARSWDINNDGIPDYNHQIFTHVYEIAGNYTVTLTVINQNGISSKTQEIVVQEASSKDQILPIADFSTDITSGSVPLSVLFTDLSQNATSREWDFNNDGIIDSIDPNYVFTYTTPGTYLAKLTVKNANGKGSKTALITALQVDTSDEDSNSVDSDSEGSSSHSSGGSSGGGTGGSPESQSNVEVKELSQAFITNGSPVRFDFPRNVTSVVYVSFDSKKTVGKTTTIAEMLKAKSILVSETPSGEIYKHLNIWVGSGGFATSKNIENAVVCFKVEKSWVQDKKIDKSSITLNRYSDKKWDQLSTNLTSEDDKYLYFTALTPGFSPFAITGKNITSGAETRPTARTDVQPLGVDEKQEPLTGNLEKNNGSTSSDVKQQPEQKRNISIPGFEMVYCITGLLAVIVLRKFGKPK
jgi:PGF-pre-PGF domain-containing protein